MRPHIITKRPPVQPDLLIYIHFLIVVIVFVRPVVNDDFPLSSAPKVVQQFFSHVFAELFTLGILVRPGDFLQPIKEIIMSKDVVFLYRPAVGISNINVPCEYRFIHDISPTSLLPPAPYRSRDHP